MDITMKIFLRTLQYAKKTEGSCIASRHYEKRKRISALLKKTKLVLGMEQVLIKWKQVILLNPLLSAPSWSGLVSETVRKLAREDERIVAITPAMPVGSKLEGFASEFPDRMFDVGIAEQHATTMAAGLATQGMKPFSPSIQHSYNGLMIKWFMIFVVKI